MFRLLALTASMTVLVPAARADDAIAPDTVGAVKKATVFIRVEGNGWSVSGTGFVVSADAGTVLIATNDHVAAPTPPPGSRPSPKPAAVTVVFDSGTSTEKSYPAAVAAVDPERDLAVLRVAGVKDAPRPISYAEPPQLVETMPVYTFGFPFGKALSATEGFPAVTVGKASVSSLRAGPDGELAVVQIDGNLNPGNSGGPVVDAKGRLVGVAEATIRDGPGIGLAVPASELVRTMRGRPGRVRVTPKKEADGTAVRVEADLIDPMNHLRTVTARYVVLPPKAKRPKPTALDTDPGAKTLELKVEKGMAAASFKVPATEGEVFVRVTATAPGQPAVAARARAFSLAPALKPADLAGPPPAGWKEYTPRDKSFVTWLPEKPTRQSERERTLTARGQRLRVSMVTGRTADGLEYRAESVVLPPAFIRVPRKELYDLFRGAVESEAGGRVTDSKEAEVGGRPGTEYVIEAGSTTTRVRVLVAGSRVYMVQVSGTADQVAGKEGETILSAFRLPSPAVAGKGQTETPGAPRQEARGKDPTILAGAFDPVFKDVAPDGGLLIGFEIGLGKFVNSDMIRAVRPIYRVGGKEVLGEQWGTQLTRVVTLKAKEGYAVGAITAKHGLMFDGMSVTFMKVADGKLDPKDAYESEWVGTDEKKTPTKLGGDGTPVVGIVGKSNPRDLTGMGLLFKGQEGFDPNPKKK